MTSPRPFRGHEPRKLFLAITLAVLATVVSSCRKQATENSLQSPGARNAAIAITKILSEHVTQRRPSAPLGMYVTLFLAQRAFVGSISAVAGVNAQTQYHMTQHPVENEETFQLLEEFGAVLQVDVADILNRSQNRPETLNLYMDGFGNITERAKRKAKELDDTYNLLRTNQRTAQTDVRNLERTIDQALRDHDYSTAGAEQQHLKDAQTALAEVETEMTQTKDVLDVYNELLDLAERRRDAIDQNRQIIIAGLQVVDVPGIEDLGLIEDVKNRSRSSTIRRSRNSFFDI